MLVCWKRLWKTVKYVSGTQAASTVLRPGGNGKHCVAGTTTCSAYPPPLTKAHTRSPTSNPEEPAKSAAHSLDHVRNHVVCTGIRCVCVCVQCVHVHGSVPLWSVDMLLRLTLSHGTGGRPQPQAQAQAQAMRRQDKQAIVSPPTAATMPATSKPGMGECPSREGNDQHACLRNKTRHQAEAMEHGSTGTVSHQAGSTRARVHAHGGSEQAHLAEAGTRPCVAKRRACLHQQRGPVRTTRSHEHSTTIMCIPQQGQQVATSACGS